MGCLRTWRQPQLLAHARGSRHHWASTLAILSMLRSNCVALSPQMPHAPKDILCARMNREFGVSPSAPSHRSRLTLPPFFNPLARLLGAHHPQITACSLALLAAIDLNLLLIITATISPTTACMQLRCHVIRITTPWLLLGSIVFHGLQPRSTDQIHATMLGLHQSISTLGQKGSSRNGL